MREVLLCFVASVVGVVVHAVVWHDCAELITSVTGRR